MYLSCENRYVGAVLFSVALLCICIQGYALFTGKVCYLIADHSKESFSVTLLALLGNLIGTYLCGLAIAYAVPACKETAKTICTAKLDQAAFQTLIRAVFCGMLVYLAVDIYKTKQNLVGILFCIPVFILSGFEHSIADLFYFACSGIVSLSACGFIWLVILGNAVGGMLLPVLNMRRKEKSR